jgi:hypothetical protein
MRAKLFYLFTFVGFSVVWLFAGISISQAQPNRSLDVIKQSVVKPVGSAQFNVLFWRIYHSELYSKSGQYQGDLQDLPVLFEIQYLRDIKREDLIERTIEQWQHLGFSQAQYQPYLAQLEVLWPHIAKGDTLALLVEPEQSHFYFNNNYQGRIDGAEFGAIFLAIWLSPNTSQPKLRQQLLGETSD